MTTHIARGDVQTGLPARGGSDAAVDSGAKVVTSRRFVDTGLHAAGEAVSIVDSTWGRLERILSSAGRHAANNISGLGIPGETWNVREAYRTRYRAEQRFGGGVGDVAALGIIGILGSMWNGSQLHTAFPGVAPKYVRAAGFAVLGVMAASAVHRISQNVRDDGHLGSIGATIAGAAGVLLSARISNKFVSKAAMLGGLVGGALAGWHAGRWIHVGSGHIGEPSPDSRWSPLASVPALAAARGAFNHFVEAGPLSTGTGFGSSWKQVDAMQQRYTDAELAGGMAGDVAAGVLVGTGALIVSARALGRPADQLRRSPLGRLSAELSVPARVVARLKDPGSLATVEATRAAAELERIASTAERVGLDPGRRTQESIWKLVRSRALEYDGKVPQLLWLVGGGLLAYTLLEAYNSGQNGKNARVNGPTSVAIAGAGVLAAAALSAKYAPAVKHLPTTVRGGVALVTGSAVLAAAMMVREPVGSFLDGARMLHQRRSGARLDWKSSALIGGGALGGAMIGRTAATMVSARRAGVRGGLIAACAALGAAAGYGFAPAVSPRDPQRGWGMGPDVADSSS